MEYSYTQKGNKVLLYLGFEYVHHRTIGNKTTWRCRINRSVRCPATLQTVDDVIIKEPTSHCHESCPQKAEANKARSAMRMKMHELPATPANVIEEVLNGMHEDILAHLPKKSSLMRCLNNNKVLTSTSLPNPTDTYFEIPPPYDSLIVYDSGIDDPERILIMADRKLMNQLVADTIYGDGTFDESPKLIYQLFTWHTKVGNSYPPCMYVLLKTKNFETYQRMFDMMKELLPELQPVEILTGFEKPCMNAARLAFPNALIKGCFSHLRQNVRNAINSVGLIAEYESIEETRITLKCLAALAFVPPQDVQRVYSELALTFPDDDAFNNVLTYFCSTFIEGPIGRNPKYPIDVWNHFNDALEISPKTTNCCERFHNVLNAIFHGSNPTIWVLFEGIQRDMAGHKARLAEVGTPKPKRRKCEVTKNVVAESVALYFSLEDKVQYLKHLAVRLQ